MRAGANVEGGESLRRHAALARLHERQRRDGRAAARSRRRREHGAARRRNGADDRRARRARSTPSRRCSRAAPTSTRKDERRGQTALMWAAAEGHAAVVEALIEAGADFTTRLASGFTPLLFAVREGPHRRRARAAESRRRRERAVPVDGRPTARLWRAAAAGRAPRRCSLAVTNAHFELAAELLDAGADPNADAARLHRAPRDHVGPQAGRRRQRSRARGLGHA